MKRADLESAMVEAARFLQKAKEIRSKAALHTLSDGEMHYEGGEGVAAVKRSSLDLSKALSKLRKRTQYFRFS